jgi:Flp pilus assembly pilin Flp
MNEPVNKPVELSDEEAKQVAGGATAIKYGLISALIAVPIIATVTALGSTLSGKFGGTTPPANK